MDSIAKKSNPHLSKPNLEIDFIESRLHAFEMMLAEDIEKYQIPYIDYVMMWNI